MVEQEGKQLEFPEEIIPHSESIKAELSHWRRILRKAGPSIILLIALGSSGYGGFRITKDFILPSIPKVDDKDSQENKNRIEDLEAYYSEFRNDAGDQDYEKLLISEYHLAKESFNGFSGYELKTNYSDDTLEFIQDSRRVLLTDGADLVNRITNSEEFVIDQDEGWILAEDVVFNFRDTYQEFILDGIITQFLVISHPDSSAVSKFEATKKKEDLFRLARQNLPIVVNVDSFGFPPENLLINMARFYQEIKRLGYPVPSEILFKFYPGNGPAGGYYDQTDDFFVTNNSGDGTVIHEWAHHQADENIEFSQQSFNETVRRGLDKQGLSLTEESVYVNSGVIDLLNPEGTLVEDYAETIRLYFEDGVGFRKLLKTLYLGNEAAYEVLLAKYEYAKDFYGGKEFLSNGEEFKPKPGDIFFIDDPDPSRTPIGLRPEPIFEPISGPVVYKDDTVEIIEGPEEVEVPSGGKAKMWKVVVAVAASEAGIGIVPEWTGWIWEIWLGSRFIPAEIAVQIPHEDF